MSWIAGRLFSTGLALTVAPALWAQQRSSSLTVDPPCFDEQAKFLAGDGQAHDWFGYDIVSSGSTALVGAPFHGGGAAYAFVRSGTSWSQQAKLIAGGDGAGTFGAAVALSGDTALVGAPGDDENGADSGSATVFVRTGSSWTQQALLLASDGAAYDGFGEAVDLSGDTALVGAYGDDDNGAYSGSAYVFVRTGSIWTEQAKLRASDGTAEDFLGRSVSVSGDWALVGAYGDDDNGSFSGSAYVFQRTGTTWTEQAKLWASDGAGHDSFGFRVSLDVDTALVSASGDDDNGGSAGAAYVFVRDGPSWTEEAKLLAADGKASDRFGSSVSLQGDAALVGASGVVDSFLPGSAYVFARDASTWTQQAKLLAGDGAASDTFGTSVSLSGSTALVGAWGDDDNGDDAGSAYVFAIPPQSGTVYCTCPAGPCGNSDPGAGCVNSTGAGARLTAFGTTQPDEVNLLVRGARPKMFALFFQSDDAVLLPFGDGFLCATGGTVPLTVFPTQVSPDGTAAYGPCFGDPTISSVTGVVPGSGEIKRYQIRYRDPAGPCGSNFNLSNGYEIVW